jgi:aspartate racemase
MKKIGLIGGVGPESTIVYYRLIIKRYQEELKTKDCPSLLINSINMMEMASLIANRKFDDLANFLYHELLTLEKAGVTDGAITSNTPHIVFNELQQRSKIKLISIVEQTCAFVKSSGLKRVALFGTKATMSEGFYNKVAAQYGIDLFTPDEAQQNYLHEKYLTELIYNDIRPETKKEFISIVQQLKKSFGIQGLILGGTELPLILSQDDFPDIKVFDSASIHVDSIVKMMVS